MKRRTIVGLLGSATVGLSGCTANQGSGTDPSPTSSDSPDSGTYGFTFDALQPAVVELQTDRLELSPPDGQYLYIQATFPSEEAPPREEFTLQFDGSEYTPFGKQNPPLYRPRLDNRYDPDDGEGWILFQFPETGDADDTRLSGGGREWEPSPSVRKRLAEPHPDLHISPSVPETVESGEQPELTVTVENRGSVPGHFIGGLSRSGPDIAMQPIARIAESIDAEATEKITVTDETNIEIADEEIGDGEPDMKYYLVWPQDSRTDEVRVTSESTSDGTSAH